MTKGRFIYYKLKDTLSEDIKREFPALFDGRWRQARVYFDDGKELVEVRTNEYYGFVSINDIIVRGEKDIVNAARVHVRRGDVLEGGINEEEAFVLLKP